MTRLRSLFFLVPVLLLSLLSSPAYSGDRFAACRPYQEDVERAVKRWWGVYQYPEAWMAQLYQESLCDGSAVSPAGARGLAQFMPATWRDEASRFGYRISPHDDIAIEVGAYYMAKRMRSWRSKRPAFGRWELGLASYNAGFGHILNAQRACGGARDWGDIETCLPSITGRHAKETRTYVQRTKRWWRQLTLHEPWKRPRGLSWGS